jgi:hypothetical protein
MKSLESDENNVMTISHWVKHEGALLARFPGIKNDPGRVKAVAAACEELVALSELVDPFDSKSTPKNIVQLDWPAYFDSAMELKKSATAELILVGQSILNGLDCLFEPDYKMRHDSDLVWGVLRVWIHALDRLVPWDANSMELLSICSYNSDTRGDRRWHTLSKYNDLLFRDNKIMTRFWRSSLSSSPQLARRLGDMSTASDKFIEVARTVDKELGQLYMRNFQGSYSRTDSRLAHQFNAALQKLEQYSSIVKDTADQLVMALAKLDAMRYVLREAVRYAYKHEGWLVGNDGIWRGYRETIGSQLKVSSRRGPLFPEGRITSRLNETLLRPMFSDLPLCLMAPQSTGELQLNQLKPGSPPLRELLQDVVERIQRPQLQRRVDRPRSFESFGITCNDNITLLKQLLTSTDCRATYPGQSYIPKWQRSVVSYLPDWLTWRLAPGVFIAPLRVPDVHQQMRTINGLLEGLEELSFENDEGARGWK